MDVFHMRVLHISFPIILGTHLQLLVVNISNDKILIMISMSVAMCRSLTVPLPSAHTSEKTVSVIKITEGYYDRYVSLYVKCLLF
jgi:hypothetical protein